MARLNQIKKLHKSTFFRVIILLYQKKRVIILLINLSEPGQYHSYCFIYIFNPKKKIPYLWFILRIKVSNRGAWYILKFLEREKESVLREKVRMSGEEYKRGWVCNYREQSHLKHPTTNAEKRAIAFKSPIILRLSTHGPQNYEKGI